MGYDRLVKSEELPERRESVYCECVSTRVCVSVCKNERECVV